MEMHQIRYALAVAHHLSFTRAAEFCDASQPALSKGVRSLDAELGQPLFHRDGKRISVSEFGRSMLPQLQRIAEEADLARTLAENFRLLNQVPVRLGVLSTIGPARLSAFLAHFHASNPGIELAISEKPLAELLGEVSAGDLDFAIISTVAELPANLRGTHLYNERYVVVLPPEHPLASANSIELSDLSGVPYVDRLSCEMREIVLAVCGERRVEIYARFRSEREDWVQAMVRRRCRLRLHAGMFGDHSRHHSAAADRPGSVAPRLPGAHAGKTIHARRRGPVAQRTAFPVAGLREPQGRKARLVFAGNCG